MRLWKPGNIVLVMMKISSVTEKEGGVVEYNVKNLKGTSWEISVPYEEIVGEMKTTLVEKEKEVV